MVNINYRKASLDYEYVYLDSRLNPYYVLLSEKFEYSGFE